MKKTISKKPVRPYSQEGVFNEGDILWFDVVRDENDPQKIHEGVYGLVVGMDNENVIVSFREMVEENGSKDPGYLERRFLSQSGG
ncbi:hypothetical protein H8D30_03110 [bacterium]|nr:hypothetical protein [bacterium]